MGTIYRYLAIAISTSLVGCQALNVPGSGAATDPSQDTTIVSPQTIGVLQTSDGKRYDLEALRRDGVNFVSDPSQTNLSSYEFNASTRSDLVHRSSAAYYYWAYLLESYLSSNNYNWATQYFFNTQPTYTYSNQYAWPSYYFGYNYNNYYSNYLTCQNQCGTTATTTVNICYQLNCITPVTIY